jgi:hypothetical protein
VIRFASDENFVGGQFGTGHNCRALGRVEIPGV